LDSLLAIQSSNFLELEVIKRLGQMKFVFTPIAIDRAGLGFSALHASSLPCGQPFSPVAVPPPF
jgi:hypothetical protein